MLAADLRKVRNAPWSIKFVHKTNAQRQQNYIEIKIALPTLAPEGVLAAWEALPVPEAHLGPACPFAECARVVFDEDLGAATVGEREVTAARIWVRMQATGAEEEVAVSDPSSKGLRAQRRVKCLAAKEDQQEYVVSAAGPASAVQWLIRAPDDSRWLLLVAATPTPGKFTVLGNMPLTAVPERTVADFVTGVLGKKPGPLLTMTPALTPLKRKQELASQAPAATASAASFSTRRVV